MFRFQAALGALVFLGACSQTAGVTERQNADYGRPIPQAECEAIARSQIVPRLKDPESARLSFGECKKGSQPSIPMAGLPMQFGYAIVANVNAKNSFGGYTGPKPWVVLIKDGKAIRRTYPHQGAQIPY